MTPQNKLYDAVIDAAKEVKIESGIPNEYCALVPIRVVDALNRAITAYEQEQPEAIAVEKTAYESALDYLSEMGYGSGTNFTSKGVASLLADFASQQTSAKDKEIAELKEAISELIQVKDWKDKNGKDEHYLKAMPIAWENVRKLIQK